MVMFFGMFLSIAGAFIGAEGLRRDGLVLAAHGRIFLRRLRALYDVSAAALPDAAPSTTGSGLCYNSGRLAAAAASLIFGWFAPVGDYRTALLAASVLLFGAALWTLWLPKDARRVGLVFAGFPAFLAS